MLLPLRRPTHQRRLLRLLRKRVRGSTRRGGRRWLLLRRQIHPSPHRCRPPTLPTMLDRLAVDLAMVMAAAVVAGAATTADFGQIKLWMRRICRGATGRRPPSSPTRPFWHPHRALKIFFAGFVFLGRLRHRRRWHLLPHHRHQRLALDTMGAVGSVRSISSSSVSNVLLPLIMTRSAPRSHRDSVARRLRVARRV